MSYGVRNVEILQNRCEVCASERMEGESEWGAMTLGGKNAKVTREGVEWRADNLSRKEIEKHTKRVLNDPIIYSYIPS